MSKIENVMTVPLFSLLAAKHAIKLEKLGIKHSSGKSARKHWALFLGMSARATHDQVVARIDEILQGDQV